MRLKAQSSLSSSGDKNRHLSDGKQPEPAVQVIQPQSLLGAEMNGPTKSSQFTVDLYKQQAQGPGNSVLVTHQEPRRHCGPLSVLRTRR